MKKNTGTLLILIWVVLVDVAIAATAGWLMADIGAKNRSISSLVSETELRATESERLRSAKKVLADTELERREILRRFVPKDSEVSFISEIESLAREAGAEPKVESVAVEPAESRSDVRETLRMKVELVGSWDASFRFLRLLESSDYDIRIDNARIGKERVIVNGKPGPTRWVGNFDIAASKIK